MRTAKNHMAGTLAMALRRVLEHVSGIEGECERIVRRIKANGGVEARDAAKWAAAFRRCAEEFEEVNARPGFAAFCVEQLPAGDDTVGEIPEAIARLREFADDLEAGASSQVLLRHAQGMLAMIED